MCGGRCTEELVLSFNHDNTLLCSHCGVCTATTGAEESKFMQWADSFAKRTDSGDILTEREKCFDGVFQSLNFIRYCHSGIYH